MENNGKTFNSLDANIKMDIEDSQESKTKISGYIYLLTCFATVGGLLFGYDTGIVSGSLLLIGDEWSLSTIWREAIVSATIGAAAISALVAGYLADKFGRKKVIMAASLIFTAGAVVMGSSANKEMLLVGRLIVGIGIGFASMVVPVYVAESAPSSIRGRLVTLNQVFITVGILVSSIVAGLFSKNKETGWRWMLGLAGVPSIVQFIGFLWLPETSRWLTANGRDDEARETIDKIHGPQYVDEEFNEISKMVMQQEKDKEENPSKIYVYKKIFTTQPVRRALFLGCGLMFFQQMCGINTVIYYSASILRMAGFPSELAIWLVCVPNAVNFLCTFIGIWLVERVGRRMLTIVSTLGVVMALVVLGIGFQLSSINTPGVSLIEVDDYCSQFRTCEPCTDNSNCGFCYIGGEEKTSGSCLHLSEDGPERFANLSSVRCGEPNQKSGTYEWADSYCPTDYSWMAVLGLALFVMGFAPGLGPMPWTINAEIYPLWARSTATSIATAVNWGCNLIISLTFLTLTEHITKYGTFYLFTGICGLGVIFMMAFLPETKNRTLEEMELVFMSKEYRHKQRNKTSENHDTKLNQISEIHDTKL
ncbi:hypothetical protein ScPMuIL_007942 [Solemya velum]